MTNKEAYLSDLEELEAAFASLLRLVPSGTTKMAAKTKATAEEIENSARATIACMKHDYIPLEVFGEEAQP